MGLVNLLDPDDDTDYTVDWSSRLPTGDAIAASTWSITPSGPTLHDDSFDAEAATASTFISGGTRGTVYRLVNAITTTDGRALDETVTLRCAER